MIKKNTEKGIYQYSKVNTNISLTHVSFIVDTEFISNKSLLTIKEIYEKVLFAHEDIQLECDISIPNLNLNIENYYGSNKYILSKENILHVLNTYLPENNSLRFSGFKINLLTDLIFIKYIFNDEKFVLYIPEIENKDISISKLFSNFNGKDNDFLIFRSPKINKEYFNSLNWNIYKRSSLMKFRTDFVTNSSSSSFIISNQKNEEVVQDFRQSESFQNLENNLKNEESEIDNISYCNTINVTKLNMLFDQHQSPTVKPKKEKYQQNQDYQKNHTIFLH